MCFTVDYITNLAVRADGVYKNNVVIDQLSILPGQVGNNELLPGSLGKLKKIYRSFRVAQILLACSNIAVLSKCN